MIKLNPNKTTGKQLHKVVLNAIKAREKQLARKISQREFLEVSNLSGMQLYRYKRGEKPAAEGVLKVTMGLKAWGIAVEVEV